MPLRVDGQVNRDGSSVDVARGVGVLEGQGQETADTRRGVIDLQTLVVFCVEVEVRRPEAQVVFTSHEALVIPWRGVFRSRAGGTPAGLTTKPPDQVGGTQGQGADGVAEHHEEKVSHKRIGRDVGRQTTDDGREGGYFPLSRQKVRSSRPRYLVSTWKRTCEARAPTRWKVTNPAAG